MYFGLTNGLRAPLAATVRPPVNFSSLIAPSTGTMQSPDNAANQALEGYCTSDGRLVWSGSAWRVNSNDSYQCAGSVTQSAQDIIEAGYPIFIGPIPWSINGAA